MEPKLVLPQIINILDESAVFLYLMGSFDTPRFNEESDIDLAIFYKQNVSLETKYQLSRDLNFKFDIQIQLVELNDIDPIFAHQVLQTGRLLFCKDDTILVQWKIKYMSMYIDFKMDREIIEKNLLHRKRYG
ncbi:MAG: type VII toxin-antitoxin system MntA family adenylyltransferase antitoxin [Pseudobdellovibrionaceae bacterium]